MNSSWISVLGQTYLIYSTKPCWHPYYHYLKYHNNGLRNVSLSILTNVFKCWSIAKTCGVQLSQCPWTNLAHLQYEALLAHTLPISKIFLCRLERVSRKCRTDRQQDKAKAYWPFNFVGWLTKINYDNPVCSTPQFVNYVNGHRVANCFNTNKVIHKKAVYTCAEQPLSTKMRAGFPRLPCQL